MKKINIVKKNQDFSNIIKKGKKIQTELFSIYLLKNDLNHNRYGISISKKIGNAAVRNKFKRQIKSSIDLANIENNSYDIVIIGRQRLRESLYFDINTNIIKIKNMIGDINEK